MNIETSWKTTDDGKGRYCGCRFANNGQRAKGWLRTFLPHAEIPTRNSDYDVVQGMWKYMFSRRPWTAGAAIDPYRLRPRSETEAQQYGRCGTMSPAVSTSRVSPFLR